MFLNMYRCVFSCFVIASKYILSLSQHDSAHSSCWEALTAWPLEEEEEVVNMGNCFTIPDNSDQTEWQLGYQYHPTIGQNIVQFPPSNQPCTYYQLYQPTYRPTLPITYQPTLSLPLPSLQPPIRPRTHLPPTRSLGVSAPPLRSTQSKAESPNRTKPALDPPDYSTGTMGMKRYLIEWWWWNTFCSLLFSREMRRDHDALRGCARKPIQKR